MTTTISDIKGAVAETYRVTITAEEEVNRFLDQLIEARNAYDKINKTWADLNNKLASYVSSRTHNDIDELTVMLTIADGLVFRADSLLDKINKTRTYIGIESCIESFKDNLEDFKELRNDIMIKVSPEVFEASKLLHGL